ncbi:putative ribonuclease H-like domain-containing protein [Tanacetum coccineum]
MSQRLGSDFKMINKACFVCGSVEHLHYVCDQKVIRLVWNNSSRVNHKNFANKITRLHPNRRFVPQAVPTRSGKINTAGANINTAVRPVNTAGSKITVSHPRPISNAFKKGYSQVIRPFNKYSANQNNIFNKKVNTVRVKDTTARDRALVSENKGKGVNAVKASACWGNPHQKEYKEKGVIDSGCSRHITGNKCYLTEYEDYDGGFVSFGDGKGRNSGKGKIKTGTLDFDNVYFCKELKYNLLLDNVRKWTPTSFLIVDSLTISMNCVPVVAETQTNGIAGTRDSIVGEEDAEEEAYCNGMEIGFRYKDGKEIKAYMKWVFLEGILQQEKQTVHPNNTNSINTVSTPEHLFERFSSFKNAFTLPPVLNVTPMDDTGIFSNAYDDEDVGAEADLNNLETTMNVSPIPTTRIDKDHPKDQIIGDFNSAIQTRRMTKISNEHAMMDVKSAFLYGTIDEEVYVCQPPGFEDPQFPDKVYKVEKALYGLHQAPRAWYETLSTYLIENGFRRDTIDKTLFIKKDKGDILFDAQKISDEFYGGTHFLLRIASTTEEG